MDVFHRSFELPSEGAPEEHTARQEVSTWSHYDAPLDETTIVTLSTLVSTRIALTGFSAQATHPVPDGFVGCEWRFLLIRGQSLGSCSETQPVHTRFCLMGCPPPLMAVRGQGGVVFLDTRHVLVLVGGADGSGVQGHTAPALDYFTLDQTLPGTPSARWVRSPNAVPVMASASDIPLLVSTVRRSHQGNDTLTDVLSVVSTVSPPFQLTATVFSVSLSPSNSAPHVQRMYSSTQRGVRWPSSPLVNDDTHGTAMDSDTDCAKPQDWEWVWVAGQDQSAAQTPVHGALIAVAADYVRSVRGHATAYHTTSTGRDWASQRWPVVVGGGVIPGDTGNASSANLAVAVRYSLTSANDAETLWSVSAAAAMDAPEVASASSAGLMPIGRPSSRLLDGPVKHEESALSSGRRRAVFLLHWILDYAVHSAHAQGPPLPPGLYITDTNDDERVFTRGTLHADATCAWDDLDPLSLTGLASLLPVTQRVRVAHAISPTSWCCTTQQCAKPGTSLTSSPPFRCFVGADQRRTRLHCLYARRRPHPSVEAAAATPLLLMHGRSGTGAVPKRNVADADEGDNTALPSLIVVEQLINGLLNAAPPLSSALPTPSASWLEQWAWDQVLATTRVLWRWCFQLADTEQHQAEERVDKVAAQQQLPLHAFQGCLDAQLMQHPFSDKTAAPPVHARHIVALACEALVQQVGTPAAVATVKARSAVFTSSLCSLIEGLDAVACNSRHEELVRQLLLLFLGSGTQHDAQRIHAVVESTSPCVCSERQAALLCLYAASRSSANPLELCVRDILSASTTAGEGQLMMMEYALLQNLDDSALFHTLQRLCASGDTSALNFATRGIRDASSMRSLMVTWEQPHVRDIVTPSRLCLPFLIDTCCTSHSSACGEGSDAGDGGVDCQGETTTQRLERCEAVATRAWSRWSAYLRGDDGDDRAPLCIPEFLLREEIADWSLFPWCATTLPQALASWHVLVARWQQAVLDFESRQSGHVDGGVAIASGTPQWVVVGRRHWSQLTRLRKGVDVLQRLACLTTSSNATLQACLRGGGGIIARPHAPSPTPTLSSWSALHDLDPPPLFARHAIAAPPQAPFNSFQEAVLSRLFLTATTPWHEPVASWALLVWEHYIVSARDDVSLEEAAACADAVLATITTSSTHAPHTQKWLPFLRVTRSVFVSLLPRLLARARADCVPRDVKHVETAVVSRGGSSPPPRRPAGEWCQQLLQRLRGDVDGPRRSGVPALELLAQLTALQPSVVEIIARSTATELTTASRRHVPSSPVLFHLSFPSLYAVACIAGHRAAVVTLAAALRPDVLRFVQECVCHSQSEGFDGAEATKGFINEHVEYLDAYTDALSQTHGGDPLWEPLLRLLFLESLYDTVSSSAAAESIECIHVAVDRVITPHLRTEERLLIRSALNAPFRTWIQVREEETRKVPLTQHHDQWLPYASQPLHLLVRERVVPQIQHSVARHLGRHATQRLSDQHPDLLHAAVRECILHDASADCDTGAQGASQRFTLDLLQQEEAFARRRLTGALLTSYYAFTSSPAFWDAIQTMYLTLRCESYRRGLLEVATQQKDMTFTLFSTYLQRSQSAFAAGQRRLTVVTNERIRTGQERVVGDEKRARARIEEDAIDSLQRLYLSVPRLHANAAPTALQPGDYVAEAGSAILGTLNKWQRRLAATIVPEPSSSRQSDTPATAVGVPHELAQSRPTTTPPAQSTTHTSVEDGWEWPSDASDDAVGVLESHLEIPAKAASQDGWEWSDSNAEKEEDWDWPVEPAAAEEGMGVVGDNNDGWDWPNSAAESELNETASVREALELCERARNAFLDLVL